MTRAAPHWTDHNASDPGITLLELGAWLGEQNIYRFDRLSDEARRAFAAPARSRAAAGGRGKHRGRDSESSERDRVADAHAARNVPGTAVRDHGAPVRFACAARADRDRKQRSSGPHRPRQCTSCLSRVRPTTAARLRPLARIRPRARCAGRDTLAACVDRPLAAGRCTRALQLIARTAAPRLWPPTRDWRRHYRVRTVWEYWSTAAWRAADRCSR